MAGKHRLQLPGKAPVFVTPRPCRCCCPHLWAPRLAWRACGERRRSWRKVLPGRTKCCWRRGCHWERWSRSGGTGSGGSRWRWCGWRWRAFLGTATSAHGSCLRTREPGLDAGERGSSISPRSWDHQHLSSSSPSHPKMHAEFRQWGESHMPASHRPTEPLDNGAGGLSGALQERPGCFGRHRDFSILMEVMGRGAVP